MKHFKTLKTTFLILFCFNYCITTKTQISNTAGIKLSAKPVPEGILITFSHIPAETSRLFINIQYPNNPDSVHDIISSHSDLRGNSLEQVKQTKKVIFPFVQAGRKYKISAIFQNEKFEDISDWIHADRIADKGIYFDNNISLNLNDTNTGVTLSSEPIFSSDVTFAETKYNFAVTIIVSQTETEGSSIGVGSNHISGVEGLTWIFDPKMTRHLHKGEYLANGSYPAFVTARCNIIYNNITWSIEIAKTREFTYVK